jgi:hypothetical protein
MSSEPQQFKPSFSLPWRSRPPSALNIFFVSAAEMRSYGIESIHEPIADRFYTNIGLEMQTLDGKIMFRILRELTNDGIPCLGIHDSVLCKRSDASTVREVMEDTYKKFLGFQPVIK